MKPAISATAAVITVAAARCRSLGQSPAPLAQLLRTQTAFDIVVHLPYAEAAPLFGPEGERPWAGKHWDPQFLYPQPAHDEQGAVFTVHHGPVTAVWVNTLFDLEARHFNTSTSSPTSWSPPSTSASRPPTGQHQVHVVYTRTALTPEGNDHVTAFTASDKSAAQDWQQAIDAYLATRAPQEAREISPAQAVAQSPEPWSSKSPVSVAVGTKPSSRSKTPNQRHFRPAILESLLRLLEFLHQS